MAQTNGFVLSLVKHYIGQAAAAAPVPHILRLPSLSALTRKAYIYIYISNTTYSKMRTQIDTRKAHAAYTHFVAP